MNEHTEFWHHAKARIKIFAKLDDASIIFGANTHGHGHRYRILPVMTDAEVARVEQEKAISLPGEFRSYLLNFGSGGAGPDYGVEDFRESFKKTEFLNPFVYTEKSLETGDVCDNESIEDFSGLIYFGTGGCGSDYYLELKGKTVGKVWCNSGDGCSSYENFCAFYAAWLTRTEIRLARYGRLRELYENANGKFSMFKKITLDEIVEHMGCKYSERTNGGSGYGVPQGQIWIYFEETPGKVVLAENREVLGIQIGDRHSM